MRNSIVICDMLRSAPKYMGGASLNTQHTTMFFFLPHVHLSLTFHRIRMREGVGSVEERGEGFVELQDRNTLCMSQLLVSFMALSRRRWHLSEVVIIIRGCELFQRLTTTEVSILEVGSISAENQPNIVLNVSISKDVSISRRCKDINTCEHFSIC